MNHFEKQEAGYLPATYEDLANAITDEHDTKYSPDGKRLLRGADIGTYEIKAGTEVICDSAFRGCTSLEQINIPDSVTSIGHSAFWSCKSLKQINIPDGVTSIGNGAFSRCESLEQINIPDNVTSIGDSAFEGCSSLRQINIPAGVTSIGFSAFWGCTSLRQINIPAGSREKFEEMLPDDKDKLVEAGD